MWQSDSREDRARTYTESTARITMFCSCCLLLLLLLLLFLLLLFILLLLMFSYSCAYVIWAKYNNNLPDLTNKNVGLHRV